METKLGSEEAMPCIVSSSIILMLPNTCLLTRISDKHTKVYFIIDSHKMI